MSFEYIRKLPSAEELKARLPLSEQARRKREDKLSQLKAILRGEDPRLLLIIGPCSADNEDALMEYVTRLARLAKQTEESLFIVPRVYGAKPRTLSEGYMGMVHQPDPTEEPNASSGIEAVRRLHLRVLEETGLLTADEMLYPGDLPYLDDVLGYLVIGARSVENQQHRLTASGLDVPVGMKNGTGGNVDVMFNAIHAAQHGHDFLYQGWEVVTGGNPYAHAILRGGVDARGRNVPNYYYEDLVRIAREYREQALKNPALIIDTNHANSAKRYAQQPRIASDVLHSLRFDAELAGMVRGFMVESYLEDGAQDIGGTVFGQSITDPCLGWAGTEKMVLELAREMSGKKAL